MEQPAAAAGWYPDPEMAHTLRYWDGSTWTDQRAPQQSAPSWPDRAEWRKPEENLTAGYWLAVLLPFIGVLYGLAKIRHGGEKVIALSIGMWVFWWVVFSSL